MIVARIYAMMQLVPAFLAGNWWIVAAILAATLLFGRVYCRFVCPLGILQSLVRLFRGPRRVCSRLGYSYGGRARAAANLVFLAAFLLAGAFGFGWQWLEPYAIASRAVCVFFAPEFDLAVWAFALVPAAVILLAAAFAGGRLWCNWVCPVGTVLAFLARFSRRKDAVKKCAGCDRCRMCFASGDAARADARPASDEGKGGSAA